MTILKSQSGQNKSLSHLLLRTTVDMTVEVVVVGGQIKIVTQTKPILLSFIIRIGKYQLEFDLQQVVFILFILQIIYSTLINPHQYSPQVLFPVHCFWNYPPSPFAIDSRGIRHELIVLILNCKLLEYQLMDSGHCLGGTGDELSYDDGIHLYLGSIADSSKLC